MNILEAAEYLNISERTLRRRLPEIEHKRIKGKTFKKVEITKDALDEFKYKLDGIHNPTVLSHRAIGPTAFTLEVPSPRAVQTTTIENVKEWGKVLQEWVFIADRKLVLTLKDCQKLTGFSREFLRDAINRKELKGRIIGRSWRVKRADLDEFIRTL